MFSNFYPTKCNTNDKLQLSSSVPDIINKYLPDDPYMIRIGHELTEIHKRIVALQSRDMTNELTVKLEEYDEERGDVAVGMQDRLDSEIRFSRRTPDRAASAQAIKDVFQKFPVDSNLGYAAESSQTDARIHAVDTEENRNHMHIIGMFELFEYYKEIQKKVKDITNEKNALEAAKLRGTVKDQSKDLLKRLDWILPYLESQSIALGGTYEDAAKEVRTVITTVMATANARQTRKENDAE